MKCTHHCRTETKEASNDNRAGQRTAGEKRVAVDHVGLQRDDGGRDAEAEENDGDIGKDPVLQVGIDLLGILEPSPYFPALRSLTTPQ